MSDTEGETGFDEDGGTDFGEEEDQNDNEEGTEEEPDGAEKRSIGSDGFEAGDREKPVPKALPQETPLTADMIKGAISMICKTGDGLEVAVTNNKLTSLQMSNFPFLQFLDFTGNPLKNTKGIKQQSLEKLILSKTQLELLDDMTSENLPNLTHLNITNNVLKKLDGLELRSLKTLYGAGNKLRNLSGLSRLTSLTRLHLRDNRLSSLKGLDEDHPTLEYLNIRSNSLEEVDELHHLSRMKKLTTLVLADNVISDSDSYRVESLVYGRWLQRIDKESVEEEERQEAAELYPQREQDRLVAEREAAERRSADGQSEPDLDSPLDNDGESEQQEDED